MRIFHNLIECHKETERELKHSGVVYQTATVQDKNVEHNVDFLTKELIGYSFLVRDPQIQEYCKYLNLNEEWIKEEFQERVGGLKVNPGEAYKLREVWDEFVHDGKFAYTYSERIGDQVEEVIDLLKRIPMTRHAIINIYDPCIDNKRREGTIRVPCSMFYNFMIRPEGNEMKLHMIYHIRSNDFIVHYPYDIVLARLLQEYIAERVGIEVGDLIFQCGSFHCFYKDATEIF